jgi:serine/threonine-protein kinase
MALASGTRIGPFEIGAQIGLGGMGEVYRATDQNLKRQVALKILPPSVAADVERLARFQREAEILASLNHPNVAAIYGLERADDVTGLVMELVEGPTLADRIAQGAMPAEEALPIAKQIADALEAAHERGIVHRDLKPANIKVRPDGTVKVLDFGLAKATEPPGAAASHLSQSPTVTTPAMTQAGVILGTAAYMSPEQARGKPLDKRADIWAFGAVLFEMLTGRRAFAGNEVSDVLASVLAREPDWTLLPRDVPPVLGRFLRRCLHKDHQDRVGDIRDVRLALAGAFELAADRPVEAMGAPARWTSLRYATVTLVAAGIGAAIAGGLVWALTPSVALTVTRSRFVLPEDLQFGVFSRQVVAVSPDGTQVVFQAHPVGPLGLLPIKRLFLRPLSELEARPIQGSEVQRVFGDATPVFSPDGRSIAYYDGALKKIATSGGTPVTLCPADVLWGMSWSGDSILFGQGPKGIMRVSANGGIPEQIVRVDDNGLAAHPQMLPGNRVVLFTLVPAGEHREQGAARWDSARIVAQTLSSGEQKTVVDGGSHARFLSTGHIVYARERTLFAVPFDVGNLEVTGGPVPVSDGLRGSPSVGDGSANYSISDSGTLIFLPGQPYAPTNLVVTMDRASGRAEPVGLPPHAYRSLRISRDGRQLALDTDDGQQAIVWVYDLSSGGQLRRLTFEGRNRFPIWSPDGQRVVFQSDRQGGGLYWQRADGTGTAERLTAAEPGVSHVPESWSLVGERLSFSAIAASAVSLWTLDRRTKRVERFGDIESMDPFNSEFSPDGRWLAYTHRSGASANVYVEPFPPTGARYQITTTNGHHPVWLADGSGLSYRIGGGEQVVVAVNTASGFSVGNPSSAIPKGLPSVYSQSNRSYDLTPDRARFVAVAPNSDTQTGVENTQEIQIVINWLEELKQRVPTR